MKIIKMMILFFLIISLIGSASAVVEIPAGAVSSYNLNVEGETYILLGDVTSTSFAFTVGADDIIFDGNGYTITYATEEKGRAFTVSGRDNVTIKNVTMTTENTSSDSNCITILSSTNCIIQNVIGDANAAYGIYTEAHTGMSMNDVVLNSATGHGLYAYQVSQSIFDNVSSSSPATSSFYIYNSNNNSFTDCTGISNDSYGLYIRSSPDNEFYNCVGTSIDDIGLYGLSSNGLIINDSVGTSNSGAGIQFSTSSNTVATNTSGYSITSTGMKFDSISGGTITNCTGDSINSTGTAIINTALLNINETYGVSHGSGYGTWVFNSTNNTITNMTARSENTIGLYIYNGSNNNSFSTIYAASNATHGLRIYYSYFNLFSDITTVSPLASSPHTGNHILLMGDSITAGGAGEVALGAWGNQLKTQLGSAWNVSNQALSGERADQGRARFTQELDIYNPQYITILYGANDISASRSEQDIIDDVLWMAHEAQRREIIPYILTTPATTTGSEIRSAYDTNLTTQANAQGIRVINVYDAIDTIPLNNEYDNYNASLFVDVVHPNNAGNLLISGLIYNKIQATTVYSTSSTIGAAPLKVRFSESGTEAQVFRWDFENDGIIDSTKQNPVHTYGKAGTYTVNLTVQNEYGNFSTVKTDYITVSAPAFASDPVAWFNWVFSYLSSMYVSIWVTA